MEIRKAQKTDLEKVVELWKDLMKIHAEQDSYFQITEDAENAYHEFAKSNLDDPDKIFLVALEDGVVIGYILAEICSYPPIYPRKSYAEIIEIMVADFIREKSVGSELLNNLFKEFVSCGIKHIECQVSASNPIANSFWKKAGFRDVWKRYYKQIMLES